MLTDTDSSLWKFLIYKRKKGEEGWGGGGGAEGEGEEKRIKN